MQNLDLADYSSDLQTMLRICNSDKAEIRNWRNDHEVPK